MDLKRMMAGAAVWIMGHPILRRLTWRLWYEYLARGVRSDSWSYMNYGYASQDSVEVELEKPDEIDRLCIQLYHRVGSQVDLAGKKVLEVGSGRGGGSSYISRYLKPRQMIGMDFSKNAVLFSTRHHQAPGLSYRWGDAEAIPFPENEFDAVVNVESSHCYGSIDAFLSEVHRVLVPGGFFLFADFRQSAELDALRLSLLKANLVCVNEADIGPNVVAALRADSERKRALIRSLVPKVLRRLFNEFAALEGSPMLDLFSSRRMLYTCFLLRKGRPAISRERG